MAVGSDASPMVLEILAPSLAGGGLPRLGGAPGRAPRPGEAGSDEAFRLLRLLDRLNARFPGRIAIHLIEPYSWAWLLRMVRYRPRGLPCFVIGGEIAVSGLDEQRVEDHVVQALAARAEA